MKGDDCKCHKRHPLRSKDTNRRAETPPLELEPQKHVHATTPKRSYVIAGRLVAKHKGEEFDWKTTEELFGMSKSTQKRIWSDFTCCTLHNSVDIEPRGRPPAIWPKDTRAIYYYLVDPAVPKGNKKRSYKEIAYDAGVHLAKTHHFLGLPNDLERTVSEDTIARWMRKRHDVGNYKMQGEKLIPPRQAKDRVNFSEKHAVNKLVDDPDKVDWWKAVFADEFHVAYKAKDSGRIKRPRGHKWRDDDMFIERKPQTKKDEKAVAKDDEDMLPTANAFCLVGYTYRKVVYYDAGNNNGKMSAQCFIEQILPAIKNDLIERGLTLV